MFCGECGGALRPNIRFCTSCGVPLANMQIDTQVMIVGQTAIPKEKIENADIAAMPDAPNVIVGQTEELLENVYILTRNKITMWFAMQEQSTITINEKAIMVEDLNRGIWGGKKNETRVVEYQDIQEVSIKKSISIIGLSLLLIVIAGAIFLGNTGSPLLLITAVMVMRKRILRIQLKSGKLFSIRGKEKQTMEAIVADILNRRSR